MGKGLRAICAFAAACATAAALSGCYNRVSVEQKAIMRVSEPMLIVPFRDAGNFYYDCEAGERIANSAMDALRVAQPTLVVGDYGTARGVVRSFALEQEMGDAAWAEIARAAGTRYVLYGSVDNLSWSDPDNPSLPRCIFTVSYSVFDATRAKTVLSAVRKGRYPVQMLGDNGLYVFEMSRDRFRALAYDYVGTVVARTFFDHTTSRREDELMAGSGSTTGR